MRTLITGIVFVLASSVNASDVYEIIESFAARVEEASNTSEVEVIELFHAETPEELEAALADGYPMPWLEVILNDESIPEEDRYWLDCRMRAAIAQDLHLFFNENGNPIYVDADYIGPGEDYWREHMMVNPLGETDVPDEDRPTRCAVGEPGYILDLYGDRVGELAAVHSFVSLSRDASLAAIQSGSTEMVGIAPPWASFACIMYPDGSFREIPFERTGYYNALVSANGEVVVFECIHPSGTHDPQTFERTGVTGEVYFYDSEGNLLKSVSPPSSIAGSGKISANTDYFCTHLSTGEIFYINCAEGYSTNLIGMSEGGRGRSAFNFSPDGNYLCAGGFSTGIVINLNSDDTVWASNNDFIGINDNVKVNCSNAARCVVSTTQHGDRPNYYYELEVFLDNKLNYTNTVEGFYRQSTIVSPNGHFMLSYMKDLQVRNSCMQTIIRQVTRENP